MDALIEVEPRTDGFYSRFNSEVSGPTQWVGPYPTAEAAEAAATQALEKVLADFAKVFLGLT